MCLAGMDIYVSCACRGPTEARREHRIPWNWTYRYLWSDTGSGNQTASILEEKPVLLITELPLQTTLLFYLKTVYKRTFVLCVLCLCVCVLWSVSVCMYVLVCLCQFLFLCVSESMYTCVVCLFLSVMSLCVCMCVFMSVCVYLYVHQSVWFSHSLCVYVSVSLFLWVSVCICLFVWMSAPPLCIRSCAPMKSFPEFCCPKPSFS